MQGTERPEALRGEGRRWRVWVVVAALCLPWPVQAGPRDFRAKIDAVDTSDAPNTRVFVTFLNDKSAPVNPKLIDLSEVRINGRLVDREDVKLGIWRKEEEGTDLVLIMPGIVGINEAAQKTISEEMKSLEKIMALDDRAGLVTYSRAVTIAQPLHDNKAKAQAAYEKVKPAGVRPFMFSSLDKAIGMLETSPEGRKRAIVYLGDGTDAGAIGIPELDAKLEEAVARARRAKVKIWTIGYDAKGINETSRRALRLLSRKTGATWRYAKTRRELTQALEATYGEIIGQIVLKFSWDDYEEKKVYEYKVRLQSESSEEVETAAFKAPVEEVRVDWIFWGIVCGISCLLFFIISVTTIITTIVLRRRRDRREAEELMAELLVDRPDECETCFRAQKPEWEACPFCAEGMAPLSNTQKAPPFVYDDEDRKLCNTCGRVCSPEWTACAFCAQGMEPLPEWVKVKEEEALLTGNVDTEKMAEDARKKAEEEAAAQQAAAMEAAAGVSERQSKIAAGGAECPTCRRIMDPKWPECLYCASGLPPK